MVNKKVKPLRVVDRQESELQVNATREELALTEKPTQQSHTTTLLRGLAFPPIYRWTLGFFLTVCC